MAAQAAALVTQRCIVGPPVPYNADNQDTANAYDGNPMTYNAYDGNPMTYRGQAMKLTLRTT